jgi:hypothetical protein
MGCTAKHNFAFTRRQKYSIALNCAIILGLQAQRDDTKPMKAIQHGY